MRILLSILLLSLLGMSCEGKVSDVDGEPKHTPGRVLVDPSDIVTFFVPFQDCWLPSGYPHIRNDWNVALDICERVLGIHPGHGTCFDPVVLPGEVTVDGHEGFLWAGHQNSTGELGFPMFFFQDSPECAGVPLIPAVIFETQPL